MKILIFVITLALPALLGFSLFSKNEPSKNSTESIVTPNTSISTDSVKVDGANFEDSQIFKKYTLHEKDSWDLKSGGKNFYYSFDDPGEVGEHMDVEMDFNNRAAGRLSLSLPSNLPTNLLDSHEETVLRDLLGFFAPSADVGAIVTFVRENLDKEYPGGSNEMPRKKIGSLNVFAGRNSSFIIGLEK